MVLIILWIIALVIGVIATRHYVKKEGRYGGLLIDEYFIALGVLWLCGGGLAVVSWIIAAFMGQGDSVWQPPVSFLIAAVWNMALAIFCGNECKWEKYGSSSLYCGTIGLAAGLFITILLRTTAFLIYIPVLAVLGVIFGLIIAKVTNVKSLREFVQRQAQQQAEQQRAAEQRDKEQKQRAYEQWEKKEESEIDNLFK